MSLAWLKPEMRDRVRFTPPGVTDGSVFLLKPAHPYRYAEETSKALAGKDREPGVVGLDFDYAILRCCIDKLLLPDGTEAPLGRDEGGITIEELRTWDTTMVRDLANACDPLFEFQPEQKKSVKPGSKKSKSAKS